MTKTVLPAHSIEVALNEKLLKDLEIESNSSNPTYQVDINSGIVSSEDGTVVVEVTSPITVDITASGVNGLDTGSEAVSTWYYLYIIYNLTSDTVAGLFSTSASSPTMPSGYTKKRLVSAIYNQSGGDFLTFRQDDNEFYLLGYQSILSGGSATSWTAVTMGNYVPSNICRTVKLSLVSTWGGADGGSKAAYLGWKTGTIWMSSRYRYSSGGDLYRNSHTFDLPLDTKSPPTLWYYQSSSVSSLALLVNGCRLDI